MEEERGRGEEEEESGGAAHISKTLLGFAVVLWTWGNTGYTCKCFAFIRVVYKMCFSLEAKNIKCQYILWIR